MMFKICLNLFFVIALALKVLSNTKIAPEVILYM